jgi:spoIIIJ-associated protein
MMKRKTGKSDTVHRVIQMEFETFTAKNVDEALAAASKQWHVGVNDIEYEVIDKGSTGLLGLGSRQAVITARKIFSPERICRNFLDDVFDAMDMEVVMDIVYNESEKTVDIDLQGDDMGILIGKRGQTLDSIQYLTSLVLNKESEEYIRVRIDIEQYRERRQETLEGLARNIAYKVKRTHRPVVLEPMNPNERRIIHSALQGDRYVVTRSEGEEPYRHVIVSLKRYGGRSHGRYDGGYQRYDRRTGFDSDYEESEE